MNFTQSVVREMSAEFGTLFNLNWQKLGIASETMGTLFETIPVADRRPMIRTLLRNLVAGDTAIITAFSIWEPDVLEGNDQAWANAPGSDSSGRFIPGYVRTLSGEISDIVLDPAGFVGEDFYLRPLRSGTQLITNPYKMEVSGERRLMATISAPIRDPVGRIVGVVGIDLDLSELDRLKQRIGKMFNEGKTISVSAAFSNDGTIVSYPDAGRIGQDFRLTEGEVVGPNLQAMATAIQAGQELKFITRMNGETYWFMVAPVTIADFPDAWAISIARPAGDIYAETYRMIVFSVILCLIILVLIIAASFWMSRSITLPIRKMSTTLKDIATGEGDLTVSLEEDRQDEIGEASHFFNQTIAKIRSLVVSIKAQASTMEDIGVDLAGNMSETASAINEIAANIQSVRSRVLNQSASVSQTNATMEQVTSNINRLGEQVEKQTHAVSQSSSAIEEMLANIQSVTATLVKNADNVKELRASADSGRSSVQEVAGDIQEIARESEGLLEINSVMENIASQTNLLSMNAAIEAAHAGEAGKGFAVVADEIRKLAESSGEQSKTIGTVLKKIKASIDKITRSTDNVLQKFEVIDQGVKTVAEQEEIIRSAMEEQGEGSRQVLQAAGQVNELTGQVKGGSEEMLIGSREVIRESHNLQHMTEEITNGMNEMATGAEQVNRAVTSVNELSGRNRENISNLVEAVSQFKV